MGYLVVGPKTFTTTTVEKAVEYVSKLVKIAESISRAMPVKKDVQPLVNQAVEMGVIIEEDEFVEEFIELMIGVNAKEYVESFLYFWETPSRDTIHRYLSDSQIVCAGEQTWGDEPQGYGFQMLKEADFLGLLKVLGIE